MRLLLIRVSFLLLVLLMGACTKSSSDSDSDDGPDDEPVAEGEFRSDCGVVKEEELINPVRAKDGESVTASADASNRVVVRTGERTRLVKLHGLREVTDFRRELARQRLNELTRGTVLYYQASELCTVSVGSSGTAYVGQLFTSDGRNISETLLREGLADTDFGDGCFGELITSCYDALEEDGQQFGGEVSEFLWKPVSERDGNLAVLLNPFGARVVVNGETLPDTGPSNGRGVTARANKPGCAFGSNIKIEAFDSDGLVLLWPGGATEYRIPNGCDRVEF